MAILLIRIENKESLPLNEFFDYNGTCYALSRSRERHEDICIDLADFYEASINTTSLKDITVLFGYLEEGLLSILGWYQNATVHKRAIRPSVFLEGNITAKSSDVVLLPPKAQNHKISWLEKSKIYEVIELEDDRYDTLWTLANEYSGKNAFIRYPYAEATLLPDSLKSVDNCRTTCEYYASRILNDESNGIVEIKLLEGYAKRLISLAPKSADGYYYHAMALSQLGFVKNGMKSIEKALRLEPGASDLMAQKAILLSSMGHETQAAEHFRQAYEKSHDEIYLLMEGQSYLRLGEIDRGYDCLKKIEDAELLANAGIKLSDMKKKWSFVNIRKAIMGKKRYE